MRLPSFVYFVKPIGMEGPIKIGCSCDPVSRLKTLMVWSPFPLEILATANGGFCEEARLMRQLREHRLHSEWFSPAAEVLDVVELVAKTGTLPFEISPPVLSNGRETDRRLLGLPAILKRNKISRAAFAAQAGVNINTISHWCNYHGSRIGAGRALVALHELGVECSFDDLHRGPKPIPRAWTRRTHWPADTAWPDGVTRPEQAQAPSEAAE